MMSSNERKPIKAQVKFTRSGWRQLARLNRSLGARLIRAFVLRHELSVYLAEHEASGVHLDTECQEVRYVDGVYLLLRRSQGIWYIMDYSLCLPDKSSHFCSSSAGRITPFDNRAFHPHPPAAADPLPTPVGSP